MREMGDSFLRFIGELRRRKTIRVAALRARSSSAKPRAGDSAPISRDRLRVGFARLGFEALSAGFSPGLTTRMGLNRRIKI